MECLRTLTDTNNTNNNVDTTKDYVIKSSREFNASLARELVEILPDKII